MPPARRSAATPTSYRKLMAAPRRGGGRPARRAARPAARAAPSASARSIRRLGRPAPRERVAKRFRGDARARLLRRAGGAFDAAALEAAERGVRDRARRCSATTSAGRSRAAARRRSPMRWPPTCARSAARSNAAAGCRPSSELPAGPRRAVRPDAAPAPLDRRRAAAGRAIEPSCRAIATAPGVFKLDLALDGPIPWRAPECSRAATVHLGGTLEEIAASEQASARGEHAERPYVLLAQQSLFDPSRAPDGKHTAWAYCHVPNGSTIDMTERIEAQIERFAPGFRDRILARHTMGPADPRALQRELCRRRHQRRRSRISASTSPARSPAAFPTRLPAEGSILCSSSTPPGGGVHGMCGYFAARAALNGPALSEMARQVPLDDGGFADASADRLARPGAVLLASCVAWLFGLLDARAPRPETASQEHRAPAAGMRAGSALQLVRVVSGLEIAGAPCIDPERAEPPLRRRESWSHPRDREGPAPREALPRHQRDRRERKQRAGAPLGRLPPELREESPLLRRLHGHER